MTLPKQMWSPDPKSIASSQMAKFRLWCNAEHRLQLDDYAALYDWSVNDISAFWGSLWNYMDILHSADYDTVVDDNTKLPGAKWFSGARMNFAENLLRYRDDTIALISQKEDGSREFISYKSLHHRVASLATAFRAMGVVCGDRVAGLVPNTTEAVIAMLAAASIGAAWSSCSPDFGVQGTIDRFAQIAPKVLIATDGYRYKGKWIDIREKVNAIADQLPDLEALVITSYEGGELLEYSAKNVYAFNALLEEHSTSNLSFEQLPFDHPLYIMYSSGTTGLPKAIVHGAGGTLLQHLKEHRLHHDLDREDVFFYFSTCGWMMWNWLVTGLASGATLVLHEGNPFYPQTDNLWKMASELGITIFGTSAKYLMHCESEGLKPKERHDLSKVRTIISTGSTLPEESFDYVYNDISDDVHLASVSGGTDIISIFVGGNPVLPVYRGELQGPGLGMKVQVFDDGGNAIENKQGELVCTAPAPSMPIHFWNDTDGSKFHHAYFDRFAGVWWHGDYVMLNSDTGGYRFFGRSDATLNPGGVRIGTAEVYRAIDRIREIEDSLAIGQEWDNDERVILFVKMKSGNELSDTMIDTIRRTIRSECTPRHVPAKIIQVPDLPYTLSGKKVELAVRNLVHHQPVSNRSALANPESLDHFTNIKALEE